VKKEGKRMLRLSVSQKYRCLRCGRYFTDREMGHKSYPAKIILNAISTYNLGHTLEGTGREMAKRFHTKLPESTIHSWVKEYSDVCTFARMRGETVKLFKPEEMVFSHNLQHNQIYRFRLHRAKLKLASVELPEQKSRMLRDYLEKIPADDFPHHIFQPKQEDLGELTRSSRLKFRTLDFVKVTKQNMANKLCELGLMLARTNRERHPCVQDFMIANDSVTVACEVPVYLTNDDINYFRSRGFSLDFENCRTPITGHIDVLQIRNGLIHILDYKPDAEKADAVNQLTIYALALASRTKLAVKDFKCAWFDERNYHEFFQPHAVYGRRDVT
jgi:ATP-dependent exoDNAse (exonuclease V) beta subunit